MDPKMKFKLISQWRSFWRMWSLRLNAIGVALLGYVALSPDLILNSWNMLPNELKQIIPRDYLLWITGLIFVLAMVARVIKQEKIPPGKDDGKV